LRHFRNVLISPSGLIQVSKYQFKVGDDEEFKTLVAALPKSFKSPLLTLSGDGMTLTFGTLTITFSKSVWSWVPCGRPYMNKRGMLHQEMLVTSSQDCEFWIIECRWKATEEGEQKAESFRLVGIGAVYGHAHIWRVAGICLDSEGQIKGVRLQLGDLSFVTVKTFEPHEYLLRSDFCKATV